MTAGEPDERRVPDEVEDRLGVLHPAEDSAPTGSARAQLAPRRPPRRPSRPRTWPVTAERKTSRSSASSRTSVTARTDAVRGTSRSSAISPRRRARPLASDRPSVDLDLDLALVDHVEPVAALTLPGRCQEPAAASTGTRFAARRSRIVGGASGANIGIAAQAPSSRTWTIAAASTARRLRQLTATTSGSQRPTTTSAACRRGTR